MTRPQATALDCTLLGLICERPMSGYDLLVQFKQTPLIRFSPSPGSIYPALKRLQRSRLITGRTDRSQRLRPREVYRPTQLGRRRVRDWLFQPITTEAVATMPDELNLRFALMQTVGPAGDVVRFLEQYKKGMRDYQRRLIAFHNERGNDMGDHWRLCLELGIRRYGANAVWADQAIATVSGAKRKATRAHQSARAGRSRSATKRAATRAPHRPRSSAARTNVTTD